MRPLGVRQILGKRPAAIVDANGHLSTTQLVRDRAFTGLQSDMGNQVERHLRAAGRS